MANVWERITDFFRPARALADRETMEALWGRRQSKAVRRLGTVGEAKRVLAAVSRKGVSCGRIQCVLDDYCERQNDLRDRHEPRQPPVNDDEEIGDPNDVHHIIPPHHDIGYAIEECHDGFALETIETLHARWTVLRLRDKIVGVSSVSVMRHERYGPCRVV